MLEFIEFCVCVFVKTKKIIPLSIKYPFSISPFVSLISMILNHKIAEQTKEPVIHT